MVEPSSPSTPIRNQPTMNNPDTPSKPTAPGEPAYDGLNETTYSRWSDAEKYADPSGPQRTRGCSQERIEEKLRFALDGHPESELWGENGLIAATMRAANYASRQQEAELKLADYLRGGGMLAAPADDGDVWEAGRSLPQCYCIDGQGRTILECVESISDAVMEEISSANVKRRQG